MKTGPYFDQNFKRISCVTTDEWRVALKKCKEHVQWRLRRNTLYGAHSPTRVGGDPVGFYVDLALEKIIGGFWEWKQEFPLSQQMVRIADSLISKQVEKSRTKKSEALKIEFSENLQANELSEEVEAGQELEYSRRVQMLEAAIKGENDLEELWKWVVAGCKRNEIAERMKIAPKQLDRLKEKLIDRVRKFQRNK